MQLIVLGMHRSGTSVLTRLLNLMGAYVGSEGSSTGANDENPKGFWERRDVRSLNDFVLHSMGCEWNRISQFRIDDVPDEVISEFTKLAHGLVMEMDAHRPWVIKEPRISLLLPLWLRVLEAPVCVGILRSPIEVASSLHKRNGIPLEVGLLLWEKYVCSAMTASEQLPQITVSHRQLVTQPVASVRELAAQLEAEGVTGLRVPAAREIEAFVEHDLYRERDSRLDLLQYLHAPQVALFDRLLQGKCLPSECDGALEGSHDEVLAAYEQRLPPMDANPKRDLALFSNSVVREKIAGLDKMAGSTRRELEEIKRGLQKTNSELAKRDGQMIQMCADMTSLARGLEHSLQESQARERVLAQKFEETKRRSEDESQELMSARQKMEKMGSELNLLRGANAAAELRISERFRETGQLTRVIVNLRKELDAAKTGRMAVETTVKILEKKLRAKDLETRSTISRLKECQQDLDRHKELLKQVTSSFAWRMITPVRAISNIYREKRTGHKKEADINLAIRNSGLFDAEWYANRYPDVVREGIDPVEHYLLHGASEGRNPSSAFDTLFYLKNNPDVAKSGMNPLLHFIWHGRTEGRSATRK